MRQTLPEICEKNRLREGPFASETGDRFGAFHLQYVNRQEDNRVTYLKVIAVSAEESEKEGILPAPHWDHVSVSARGQPPLWEEMEFVRKLFFAPDECVVQFHVPDADHINVHENVLHMWKCPSINFPRPPQECV